MHTINVRFVNSFFTLVFLLNVSIAVAAEWRVTPIRLDLGRDAKSGTITLISEGDERLNVQMKAFEWTQDEEGKDLYAETSDIIFFPKIMTVEKKESRVIRAGIKMPAVTKEKSYRLFIEEIPEPIKGEGAAALIAIRFGVPIFVKPLKDELQGEIEKIEMSGHDLKMVVKNTGNQHFIINSVNIKGNNAKGEEIFTKELSGWYLLNGASRVYSSQIPPDLCKDVSLFDVEVKTDKLNLNGKLDVDKTMREQ